jgi:hypothetical protein
MRQPDVATLQVIVAALPDDRLRPLLLELLGVTPTVPVASADAPAPADDASTTTPTPRAKHPGGRPPGSRNKVMTGARAAARLASLPNREQIVRAVAAGDMTQVAAAKALQCTAKTVSTWVERYRREQQAQQHAGPAAPEQHGLTLPNGNGGEGAARATRPAPAKASGSITADPALAPALWQKAAERQPTAPWKSICEEFGIPIVTAMEHCRARTMPPIAPAAAARFLEMAAN